MARRTGAGTLLARVPAQLRRVFGLRRLRPGQFEVIERALRGLDTLAVMPTGAGKSLCYQLPASLLPGLTVVVSPLIALMQDQYDRLAALGLSAVQLNSALGAEAEREAISELETRRARIVFTTPERLADPEFLATLRGSGLPISLLVIDEAHCISHWGDDFRPAYGEIGALLPALGKPPVLALTATAASDVADDIAAQLKIPAAGRLTGTIYRPNLQLAVETVADEAQKQRRALELLGAAGQAGDGCAIAYCATIKAATALHEALAAAGVDAGLYHGRLAAAQRRETQQAFVDGRLPVIVATNAFGLGIDKPDVRLVLHYQMPGSLDAYYQEAGRAGRDGAAAQCTLLFLAGDRAVQQFFLNGRYPGPDDAQALLGALNSGREPAWTVDALQERLQRPATKLRVLLNLLRRERWLSIDDQQRIAVDDSRPPPDLDALLQRYLDKRDGDHERLEQIVAYAQSGSCRWRALLAAFDERPPFEAERCGHCDNCRRLQAFEAARRHEQGEQAPPPAARARFAEGDAVRVRRYGAGTVVAASAEAITVRFGPDDEAKAPPQRSFHPDFVRPARRAAVLDARCR